MGLIATIEREPRDVDRRCRRCSTAGHRPRLFLDSTLIRRDLHPS